jgi:hypothetical protein
VVTVRWEISFCTLFRRVSGLHLLIVGLKLLLLWGNALHYCVLVAKHFETSVIRAFSSARHDLLTVLRNLLTILYCIFCRLVFSSCSNFFFYFVS